MATMHADHNCPLCGSPLTRKVYERVLHIDEGRKKEMAEADQRIATEWRELERHRQAMKSQAAAEGRKAAAKARKEETRLREELRKAHKEIARKATLSAQEKQKIAHQTEEKSEARFAARLRKSEEQRIREGQRRQRDANAWKRKIEELQRRTEGRDHLHFGPEGEEELEALLRRQFGLDDIQRRGRGGDIIHTIVEKGQPCGIIVYECKQTGKWEPGFVRQLKRALEASGTRWGLLVSRVLPPQQSGICVVDGVIVCAPHLAHHMAGILRDTIVELARADLSQEGKGAKTEEIYRYLRSEEFLSAVRTIAQRVRELRATLEREKTSHSGWWESREQHYGAIARQASGVGNRINEILTTSQAQRGSVHLVHG